MIPPQGGDGYIEMSPGMHYQDNGVWKSSQDLIELNPNGGAQAVQGPHQVHFSANINVVGSIEQVIPGGLRLRSHPAGLFLFSPRTGNAKQIAGIKDAVGQLLPPNQIVYRDCFEGVAADLRLTYTRAAFESDVILRESVADIIAAEPDFAGDDSVRVEVWTEFLEPRDPRVVTRLLREEQDPVVRSVMVEPDLTDDILDFGELLFIPGKAFAASNEPVRDAQTAARIDLSPESEAPGVEVSRKWYRSEGRSFLIESVKASDLNGLMAALPKAEGKPGIGVRQKKLLAAQLPVPRERVGSVPPELAIQVADVRSYRPSGVVMDYRDVVTSGSETFLGCETVYVAGTTYFATITFQPGSRVKLADNAYLLAYSGIYCNATASYPAWLTSRHDDTIGDVISGSTGSPVQNANPAIWVYYISGITSLSNLRVKWAKKGIKMDSSGGGSYYLSSSNFEDCQTGVEYTGSGSVNLSGVTYCDVTTPMSGSYSGSAMTAQCLTETAECPIQLATPTSTNATEKPGAMVLGDLNNDHRPDMVTASTSGSSITFRLGNADGSFTSGTPVTVGAAPTGLALADVNQDLWLDIVVTHGGTAQLSVLLGSSSGTFSSPLVFSTGSGSIPVAVAIGDLDGNFTPDLVVASGQTPTGTLRVLLRGATATPTSVSYGSATSTSVGSTPKALALADFNRDGKLDAAVVNEADGTVSFLPGNGNGTFGSATTYNTGGGTGRQPRAILAEDFERDGYIDIAVANYETATVATLKNVSTGSTISFAPAVEGSMGSGNKPVALAIADLDGDTWADLIAAKGAGTGLLSVFRGSATGVKTTRSDVGSAAVAAAVQSRDVDRDGRPDVVISDPSGNGKYHVSFNIMPLAGAVFAAKVDVTVGSAADALVMRRLTTDSGANIDPHIDIAVASGSGNKVRLFAGDGTGGFSLSTDLTVPSGSSGPVALAVGDLDHNGYVDVVSANYVGGAAAHVTVWLKSATDASFGGGVNYSVGANGARAIVLGNFNEDASGHLDAVVANQGGDNLSFLPGNGNGTFGTAVPVSLGSVTSPQPWALVVGRFDNNHTLDLAIADKNAAKVTILTGDGDGTFTHKADLTAGTSPKGLVVGDFDRNGKDDVIVANEGSNTLRVYLNDDGGTGNFAAPVSYTTGSQPNGLAVYDVNMDGWVDVVVACKGDSKAQVFRGLGNGKFVTPGQDFATASSPVAVVVTQIDNDSKPDLMVACANTSGSVSRRLNDQQAIPEIVYFAFPQQKNVNLSKRVGPDTETAIAINRANPENIVAYCIGFQAANSGFVSAVSKNGGRTWTSGYLNPPGGSTFSLYDPSVAFDRFGNLYLAMLQFDVNLAPQVIVRWSTDGGASLRTDTLFSLGGGNIDQPIMVTGPSDATDAEQVWVKCHSSGSELGARLEASALESAGPFGDWFWISRLDEEQVLVFEGGFGDVAISATGDVGVGSEGPKPADGIHLLEYDSDEDPRAPFQHKGSLPPSAIIHSQVRLEITPQVVRGVGEELGMVIDRSAGPFSGRIYLIYTDTSPSHYTLQQSSQRFIGDKTSDTDVMIRFSDDFFTGTSAHWSEPQRVNTDVTLSSQFLPRISIDHTTGDVAIGFLDASEDSQNRDVEHVVLVSKDGGRSFSRRFVGSLESSDATALPAPPGAHPQLQFGDYTALDFHEGTLFICWPDNSNVLQDAPDHPQSPTMEMYAAKLRTR